MVKIRAAMEEEDGWSPADVAKIQRGMLHREIPFMHGRLVRREIRAHRRHSASGWSTRDAQS